MSKTVSFLKSKIFAHVMLILLVLSILLALVFLGLNIYTRHNQSIKVPDVKGLQVEQAATFLNSAGLKYEVVDSVYQKGGIPGGVIDQVPKAASMIKIGRTIYLTVQAKGAQVVAVPDLTDYSERQAMSLLQAMGFTNIQVESVSSEYKDLVISVENNNKPISKGQKLPLDAFIRMKVGDGSIVPEDDSLGVDQPQADDPVNAATTPGEMNGKGNAN